MIQGVFRNGLFNRSWTIWIDTDCSGHHAATAFNNNVVVIVVVGRRGKIVGFVVASAIPGRTICQADSKSIAGHIPAVINPVVSFERSTTITPTRRIHLGFAVRSLFVLLFFFFFFALLFFVV
jgi:hypothetical protein